MISIRIEGGDAALDPSTRSVEISRLGGALRIRARITRTGWVDAGPAVTLDPETIEAVRSAWLEHHGPPWYVSARSVWEWVGIGRLGRQGDEEAFEAAEHELLGLTASTAPRLASTTRDGYEVWRTGRISPGRRPPPAVRVELIVDPSERPEGPLPALVHARIKGR